LPISDFFSAGSIYISELNTDENTGDNDEEIYKNGEPVFIFDMRFKRRNNIEF